MSPKFLLSPQDRKRPGSQPGKADELGVQAVPRLLWLMGEQKGRL